MNMLRLSTIAGSVLLLVASSSWTQTIDEEERACREAANQLMTELRPHSSTPEMYYPDTSEPKGDGKNIPTLPKGARPVGPRARILEEQRGNLAELRAEACYKIAVEIGRHYGLSLDGKESYQRLQVLKEQKEREAKEQANGLSRPASCRIPGTETIVSEKTTQCIAFNSPAICPKCVSGYRHTCTRVQGTNDAEWIKSSKCLAGELRSAQNAANGGLDDLYTNQARATQEGQIAERLLEREAERLSAQPQVQPFSNQIAPARKKRNEETDNTHYRYRCVVEIDGKPTLVLCDGK